MCFLLLNKKIYDKIKGTSFLERNFRFMEKCSCSYCPTIIVPGIGQSKVDLYSLEDVPESRHTLEDFFIVKVHPEDIDKEWKEAGLKVESGIFGADMKISLLNDGPVTILLDSKKLF